jgi:hypothetical protein
VHELAADARVCKRRQQCLADLAGGADYGNMMIH